MMKGISIFAASLALLCCGCGGERASSDVPASTEAGQAAAASARPAGNPFPEATEVRLFVNTHRDEAGREVFDSPDGLVLSASQKAEFEALLCVEPMPDDVDACFIPHHFFRYFDAAGNRVGEVAVCFCCEGVAVDEGHAIAIGDGEQVGSDFAALRTFVRSLGKPVDVQC